MSTEYNDMGNLFQQRRAAAAARKEDTKPVADAGAGTGETVTNKPKKNLLEIQAEQAQERAQNSSSRPTTNMNNNNSNNSNSNNPRNAPRRGEPNQSANNSRGGARRDRGGGGGSGPSRSNLPIEQGIICSLKESFGFIHCAERPEELFFHYSEVSGCHPDELKIDTEVEFRIGAASNSRNSSNSDEKKMAAFQVKPLAPGTVVWETEIEPGKRFQGLVDRQVRIDQRGGRDSINNSSNEGSIRILEPQDAEPKDGQELKATGSLARFLAASHAPPENKSMDIRSANGPNRLFRGDLVEFTLFTDRRTKELYARTITLVQSEKDRSRIEKEKKLMEHAVPEEGVVISLKSDFGFLKSNKRREHIYFHYSHMAIPETEEEFVLKEGQEMKFLVVVEDDNQNQKCSARKLACLPKGSVIFHRVVAEGLTGIVTACPRPPSNNTATDEKDGTVRLVEPISDNDPDGEEKTIQDVSLHFGDCPGGVFSYQQRGGVVAGLWIQEGDTLLFDVVKEFADGSYRAAPTQNMVGKDIPEQPTEDAIKDATTAAVRLVDVSMVGRAEGVVHALKESGGFGFIHFADRAVDVHFKLYDLLPDELQSDLRKRFEGDGKSLKLQVGAAVQFDFSALGTVSSNTGRGRQGRGGQHDRENLKAQRIVILPSSTVSLEKVVATGVKGVVKSEDVKQLYAGVVELEEEFESISLEERHPLVAKMINSFLEESSSPSGRKSLVFRDILSMKEDDVVVEMVKAKGKGLLSCTHIPVAGLSSHPGRLCIRRLDEEEVQEPDDKNGTPSKRKNSNPIKTFRFEKPSLAEELKDDVPPGIGDVITCDIVQMRRTGKVAVQNVRVLERKEREPGVDDPVSTSTTGVGIVKEVVPNRNFGFISVLDDYATKRDLLFFRISDIISDQGDEEGLKSKKPESVRKGDEVKFQVGTEKNGKRVALNVQVVPKGTIPAKATKNACRGLILMEPSLVSLSDTPLRKSHSTASQGSDKSGSGRWRNVKEEQRKTQRNDIVEEGCILLLEDNSGMFSKKSASTTKRDIPAPDEGDATDKVSEKDSDEDTAMGGKNVGVICTHLPYRNGAIAIHGAGSSSAVDDSSNPRRGDIVTFVKAKSGKGVRDVRVLTRQAVTLLRGRLEDIVRTNASDGGNSGTAKFIAATEREEEYDVDLAEVVSCDVAILKEKQVVEGVLHEGRIFGICRTTDLYLESKLGAGHKERPRLNLSVKKDRGGKIIAQSMMAKGPDGTHGFALGWTTRTTRYADVARASDGNA